MNNIYFADVYISALTLNIFRGSFNKESLCIIKEKKIEVNGYFVELAIIGASHYISISKNKEVIFSEVFACVNIEGATQYKDKKLRKVESNVFDYSFSSYLFELSSNIDKVQRFKENYLLIYEFGETKEFEESAITGLILNEENGIIELETIHVYPNENKAIITNSSFNLKS